MEKLLIVDDDKQMVALVHMILDQDGYDMVCTSDPQKALNIIRTEALDLVVTDLNLGAIDGLEIAREAKATNEDVEIILITGYATLESAVSALRQGIYDYILKPFRPQELRRVVSRAAESQRMRRTNVMLNQKIKRNLRDITTLYEIGGIINSCQDLDEAIDFVIDAMVEGMNVDICSVMLVDPQEDQFKIRRAVGLSEPTVQNFRIGRKLTQSVPSLFEGQPARYIEVKGRAGVGVVALTPNEWIKAQRFGQEYWLYIVANCKSQPELHMIQDPASKLSPKEEVSVVRYMVGTSDWKRAAEVSNDG